MSNVIPLAENKQLISEANLQRLDSYVDYLKHGSEIRDLVLLGEEVKTNGTLHRFGFITAAGYAYNANIAVPYELSSDIPIFATCAWGTSPRGHNEHTALKLMEDGLATVVVGNEGSYRPKKLVRPKTKMTLAGTAAAGLNFSQEIIRDFNELHPVHRTALGESKGGMEGMGSIWLAPFFNQDILMADYTAPCIPVKIELSDLREFSSQLKSEPLSIAKLAGRLTLGLVLHYPATADIHPYALAHQAAKGVAVFSGEAGDLGKMVDRQQLIHMSVFSKDFASMRHVWEEIFNEHPNVRITPLEGSHLTIADPETLAYIRARQRSFREVYDRKAGDMSNISGDEVYDLAHDYVADYMKPQPNGVINKLARLVFGHSKPAIVSKAA